MSAAPIATAEHVSKWYGQVIGLNDVSVSVPPGITGLLGPNGAGKSTFMKLITGQLKPSKGDVKVLGEPIWRNPHLYFQIGFCPEQDAFYERMTGLEWVRALVRLNGLSDKEADDAAHRALTAVDLRYGAKRTWSRSSASATTYQPMASGGNGWERRAHSAPFIAPL